LSLAFDTVRSIAVDIALGAARTGFSCLVVVNGDYGNQAPLRAAAKHVNATMGFKILVVDYPGLAEIAIDVLDTPAAGPGIYHADELETSMVLALEPGSVEMGLAAAYYPDVPPTFGSTPIGFDELSPSGVLGDPTAATAAKGERLLELLTERAVALATNFVGGLPAR